MFDYAGTVVRVVDGDTVIMDVDLGFGVWLRAQSFRLLGLNAREHREVGGLEAKTNLETCLPVGQVTTVTSVKADKYGGRYDAVICLPNGLNINAQLIHDGWAAAWSGAGTKPVPPWPRKAE
jgi:endonuclease YncB( thermonuclease family)